MPRIPTCLHRPIAQALLEETGVYTVNGTQYRRVIKEFIVRERPVEDTPQTYDQGNFTGAIVWFVYGTPPNLPEMLCIDETVNKKPFRNEMRVAKGDFVVKHRSFCWTCGGYCIDDPTIVCGRQARIAAGKRKADVMEQAERLEEPKVRKEYGEKVLRMTNLMIQSKRTTVKPPKVGPHQPALFTKLCNTWAGVELSGGKGPGFNPGEPCSVGARCRFPPCVCLTRMSGLREEEMKCRPAANGGAAQMEI